ncbi:glycerophosphodiester phosphodiesterase 1 [Willisornis vidua]|uniref:Glycerophosphodiester phosphodiesterase 1 n=1 Tax=Willisornis vidua TaxID=1566151 RepID=A0ABQ9CRS3_9PASS|nr:glycerophosphodiester phosphodiesterase 1 [Willisornis vidua]
MLCHGESLLSSLTALLVLLLALSRSPALTFALPAGLCLALHLLALEPAAPRSAQRVLQPLGGAAARIAHRGGSHDAPENTLAAIRQAAENGATGVELDVEFTADGVAILMHDDTVERTTDGSGRLSDLTFDEIRKLNPSAKHRLRSKFQDEKIPTLREAVVESLHHNLTIFFDIKGHANQAVDALKQLYLEFPHLYNSSIVCSFMPDVVYKGVFIPCRDYVRHWASKGIQVVPWTVNTFAEKTYIENILKCSYITDSLVEDCDPHY